MVCKMSSDDVKNYFNMHDHDYGHDKDPSFYIDLSNFVHRIKRSDGLRILDVGCGSGSFIKALIECGTTAHFVGIDLSEKMIERAKSKLKDHDVELYVMDVNQIRRHIPIKYNVIHLGSVLHHLIGRTQGQSKKLAEETIKALVDMLENQGVLIIEEIFYHSYIIPTLTSKFIFYGLKLLNRTRLDMSNYIPQVQLGLEVSFFSEKELRKLLQKYSNNVINFRRESWPIPKVYRYFLLKDCGHMTYVATRNQTP
jgi:SAM-dependent methyltransferase